jgi:hypothetical protein
MIVCLGWGSLIWRRENLPVVEPWLQDGPSLPIEFARQSDNGRITLVVIASRSVCPVLWAALNLANLDDARRVLSEREGPGVNLRRVAHWSRANSSDRPETAMIGAWAEEKGFEAVVWTALGPRVGGENGRVPTETEVVSYLNTLNGAQRADAEKYVRCAPAQIRTPYRAAIETALGWMPLALESCCSAD